MMNWLRGNEPDVLADVAEIGSPQKTIRDLYQKISDDIWVIGPNGPARLTEILGISKVPVRTVVNDEGQLVVLRLMKNLKGLRPGIQNAAQNTVTLPKIVQQYIGMANRSQKDKMRVDITDLFHQLVKNNTKRMGFEFEQGYVKIVADPFLALDQQIGRGLDLNTVSDFSTIQQYGHFNQYGGTNRLVVNPVVSTRMIQDFDRDALLVHKASLIDLETGMAKKQEIHGYKFPAHTNQVGMILQSANSSEAARLGTPHYDPLKRVRRMMVPGVDELFHGVEAQVALREAARNVDRERLENTFRYAMQEDLIGQLTHKMWSVDEAEAMQALIRDLPEQLTSLVGKDEAVRLSERIKNDPAKLMKWKYLYSPQVRSGKFRESQENLIKALGSGRLSGDEFLALQANFTLSARDRMFMYPKNEQNMTAEERVHFNRLLSTADPQTRAAMIAGAAVPEMEGALPHFKRKPSPIPVNEVLFAGPGQVEGSRGTRQSFLRSLLEESIYDPSTKSWHGLVELQSLTFPDNYNLGPHHKGTFITLREFGENGEGRIRPIIGSAPRNGAERAAYINPIRSGITGEFKEHFSYLESEFERRVANKFLETNDGRAIGELSGRFDFSRLSSQKGYREVQELARIAGKDTSYIYDLLRQNSPEARRIIKSLVTQRDLQRNDDALPTIHKALQELVGDAGKDVNARRDSRGILRVTKEQATRLSEIHTVDMERYGLDDVGQAQGLMKVWEKTPILEHPRRVNERFSQVILANPENVHASISMSADFYGHAKRNTKSVGYDVNNIPFQTRVALMDYAFTEEELSVLRGTYGEEAEKLFGARSLTTGAALLTEHGMQQTRRAIAHYEYADMVLSDVQNDEFVHPFEYQIEDGTVHTKFSKKPIDPVRIIQSKGGAFRIEPDPIPVRATLSGTNEQIGMFMGIGELADKHGNVDAIRRLASQEGGDFLKLFQEAERAGFTQEYKNKLTQHLPTEEIELELMDREGNIIERLKKRLPVLLRDDLSLGNTETDIKSALLGDEHVFAQGSQNIRKYVGDVATHIKSFTETESDVLTQAFNTIQKQLTPSDFENEIGDVAGRMLAAFGGITNPISKQEQVVTTQTVNALKHLGAQAAQSGMSEQEVAQQLLRIIKSF